MDQFGEPYAIDVSAMKSFTVGVPIDRFHDGVTPLTPFLNVGFECWGSIGVLNRCFLFVSNGFSRKLELHAIVGEARDTGPFCSILVLKFACVLVCIDV